MSKSIRYEICKRKYDSKTKVKFPVEFLPSKEWSGTFVDVRVGCSICSRGLASTMDVYPIRDYYNKFTAIEDIDIRMPYYNYLDNDGKNDDWGMIMNEKWYLWKNP